MFVGKRADDTGYFEGQLHELRIWEKARSQSSLTANMSVSLSGSEAGLYRLWEMNDGNSNVFVDKVRSQIMQSNASWANGIQGSAVTFVKAETNYIKAKATNILIDKETDLTIEFWYKRGSSASGTNEFFISTGKEDKDFQFFSLDNTLVVNKPFK